MAMYQPSSSSSSSPSPASSSRTQSSYGYYANGDVYLPPVHYERNDSPGAKNISVHERSVMIEKISRYSAEERKERIERYRSKRNQRNFQKKITYECRKTLADSRPRIRGRFARNDEAEVENTGSIYGNYNHNQVSNDLISTDNGKAGGAESYDDEELWAILYGDSSYVNI